MLWKSGKGAVILVCVHTESPERAEVSAPHLLSQGELGNTEVGILKPSDAINFPLQAAMKAQFSLLLNVFIVHL